MRPAFAVVLAVLVIGLSLVEWWAGLLVLGWIAAMFAYYRLGGP